MFLYKSRYSIHALVIIVKVLVMKFSTVHISIVLSVVCMGVVFVGGWYLQSSLTEEQYHNMEQVDQLNKITDLNNIIENLLNEVGEVCTYMYVYVKHINILQYGTYCVDNQ